MKLFSKFVAVFLFFLSHVSFADCDASHVISFLVDPSSVSTWDLAILKKKAKDLSEKLEQESSSLAKQVIDLKTTTDGIQYTEAVNRLNKIRGAEDSTAERAEFEGQYKADPKNTENQFIALLLSFDEKWVDPNKAAGAMKGFISKNWPNVALMLEDYGKGQTDYQLSGVLNQWTSCVDEETSRGQLPRM